MSDLLHEMSVMSRSVLLEAMRRRTFAMVAVITLVLLALFAWAVDELDTSLRDVGVVDRVGLDARAFATTQLAGIALFGIFFIGAVLGVLLNHGAIRGDAEQGLLQQVVARPIGRTVLLVTRWAVVAGICGAYVFVTWALAAWALHAFSVWDPGSTLLPGAWLAAAVASVCAITIVVSIFLPTSAAGILVFLLVGVALAAGMVMQLTAAVGSDALDDVASAITWLLPFERSYQAAVDAASPGGFAARLKVLGPFANGRPPGELLAPWLAGWFVVVLGAGSLLFARRDL